MGGKERIESEDAGARFGDDIVYQETALQGVSRTFALTIPQLPGGLRTVVGNAYLLCRIADTIEDSDTLPIADKRRFYSDFVSVVAGEGDAQRFADELTPLLQGSASTAELDLVSHTARVIRITHSFRQEDRHALLRCVRIMSEGMEEFQESNVEHGLRDLRHLDAYCYHVAGVVGEMLTELFCSHSADTAARRTELEKLAVSFGQGLQMTNILKDIWDDKERRVCWLPRSMFDREGFDLDSLDEKKRNASFEAGLVELIAVAQAHLERALAYTLLIPRSEEGIRRFCLWAIGMAVLTLKKIKKNPGFTSGSEVKISRGSVKGTILVTSLFVRSNMMLRLAFRIATIGLPRSADTALV